MGDGKQIWIKINVIKKWTHGLLEAPDFRLRSIDQIQKFHQSLITLGYGSVKKEVMTCWKPQY